MIIKNRGFRFPLTHPQMQRRYLPATARRSRTEQGKTTCQRDDTHSRGVTHGPVLRYGEKMMRRLRDPGCHTQVAFLVDAIPREDGCIVKPLLPDTDSAQLITDYFYLFNSILHSPDVYLAGDTLKRCIEIARFTTLLTCMSEYCREFAIFRRRAPVPHPV